MDRFEIADANWTNPADKKSSLSTSVLPTNADAQQVVFDLKLLQGIDSQFLENKKTELLSAIFNALHLWEEYQKEKQSEHKSTLLARWDQVQLDARRLNDQLEALQQRITDSENISRSITDAVHEAARAVKEAKGIKLPKHPTQREIAANNAKIIRCEARLLNAQKNQSEWAGTSNGLVFERATLRDKYNKLEAEERELANQIHEATGEWPVGYSAPVTTRFADTSQMRLGNGIS